MKHIYILTYMSHKSILGGVEKWDMSPEAYKEYMDQTQKIIDSKKNKIKKKVIEESSDEEDITKGKHKKKHDVKHKKKVIEESSDEEDIPKRKNKKKSKEDSSSDSDSDDHKKHKSKGKGSIYDSDEDDSMFTEYKAKLTSREVRPMYMKIFNEINNKNLKKYIRDDAITKTKQELKSMGIVEPQYDKDGYLANDWDGSQAKSKPKRKISRNKSLDKKMDELLNADYSTVQIKKKPKRKISRNKSLENQMDELLNADYSTVQIKKKPIKEKVSKLSKHKKDKEEILRHLERTPDDPKIAQHMKEHREIMDFLSKF